jgi:O-antigen ligase
VTTAIERPVIPWEAASGVVAAVIAGFAIALLPSGVVFAVAFISVVLFVSVWRPALGLACLAATIPIQTSVTLDVGSRHLTFTKAALAALVVGWLVNVCWTRGLPPVTSVTIWLVLYILALIASIWDATNLGSWAGETYRWLTAAIVYLIAAQCLKRRDDVLVVLVVTSLSVIACLGAAIVQVIRHSGPPSFTVNGVTRAFGAFGEPNPFAAYFEIAALPLLGVAAALLLAGGIWRSKWLIAAALVGSGCGLVGIILTHSRGGAVGAVCGIGAIALVVDRRIRLVSLAAVGLLALAILVSGRTSAIVDRVEALGIGESGAVQVTTANFSVEERVAHWGAAIKMWEQHPVIGVGAGNFNEHFRLDTPVWRFRIPRGHAHDGYLQAAAQAGSIGLAAYVGLLAAALVHGLATVARSRDPLAKGLGVGAIGATVAVMSHGVFDYLHVLNLGLQLSIAWGMLEFATRTEAHSPEGFDHG